jgi:uncharacterized membrane protein YhaH (DUF805 family)
MDATFLVISLIVSVIFAVICYRMAIDRGRNGTLWAVLGFVFPLISLIVLLLLGRKEQRG